MADRCLLYYITDRSQFHADGPTRRRMLLAKVAEAARAGVDYIQLRETDLSSRELEILAQEVLTAIRNNAPLSARNRELITGELTLGELTTGEPTTGELATREAGTRLLINSRTDIALAVGADGVHLRSHDITPQEVRQIVAASGQLSPKAGKKTGNFLVAASCHSNEEVIRAESEGADFAVLAPVFGKHKRPEAQPAGISGLREACRSKIPIFALGGVTVAKAASCLNAGAAGIAAIRLFQENKIENVVRALRAL
jgi:thiamine-phosphate diphosphorylase